MRRIVALFVFTLLTASSVLNAGNDKRNIVPAPQRWLLSGGELSMSDVRIIKPDDSTGLFAGLMGEFEKELKEVSEISVTTNSGVYILFESIKDPTLGDEGYRLIIEDNIKVLAQGYSGMLYATRTILQLLSQSEDRHSLPKGIITDYPEY
jgi:hexosaminidase